MVREMASVEDTMNRLARAHHHERGISFVTSRIVLMGLESTKSVQMMDVTKRTTNLEKVAKVNEYSRYFVEDRITLIQLNKMLQILDYKKNDRPMSLKVLSLWDFKCVFNDDCWTRVLVGFCPNFFGWGDKLHGLFNQSKVFENEVSG